MKEKIEAKINEILDNIMAKDAKDISYNEYRILDAKLSSIKYEEEQEARNKEMGELMAKTFSRGFGMPAAPLPDPVKED